MTPRTSKVLVPFALCAMGFVALVFTGCKRESEKSVPPPHAPESYMNDPQFVGKLAAERKEQVSLERERNAIALQMKEMVEAMREKLKTDDLKKVRAELEKDPKWIDLHTRCTNANAKCVAHRRATLEGVRQRLTPPKPVSK